MIDVIAFDLQATCTMHDGLYKNKSRLHSIIIGKIIIIVQMMVMALYLPLTGALVWGIILQGNNYYTENYCDFDFFSDQILSYTYLSRVE